LEKIVLLIAIAIKTIITTHTDEQRAIINLAIDKATIIKEVVRIEKLLLNANNQGDRNHCRNLLIEQLKQYEKINTDIANQYKAAGLQEKSLEYKACALEAADIAQTE
jgi:hypothetical protein